MAVIIWRRGWTLSIYFTDGGLWKESFLWFVFSWLVILGWAVWHPKRRKNSRFDQLLAWWMAASYLNRNKAKQTIPTNDSFLSCWLRSVTIFWRYGRKGIHLSQDEYFLRPPRKKSKTQISDWAERKKGRLDQLPRPSRKPGQRLKYWELYTLLQSPIS